MPSFWEILSAYWLYGVMALVVSVLATAVAIRAAYHFRVLDIPDQQLKPHARPTPYLGGAAICVAWVAALTLALMRGAVNWHVLLPILLGGAAISCMGLIDDVRGLSPRVRLWFAAAVILVVLLTTGTGFKLVDSVCILVGWEPPPLLAVPLSVVLSVLLVLGTVNSTNLIDGLDGLCSGVTAIISLSFFLMASHLAHWGFSTTGDPVRLALAIAMLGAAVGFLPFNFNPARIFMGDAGSVLLGYNCGMLILLFAERASFRWMLGALMIFALPIFDTSLAVFRRWRSGKPLFEGDRSHFYDQLVQRGLSVRQTVLVCYALTLFYALLGLLLTGIARGADGKDFLILRVRYAIPLYVLVCVATAAVAWWTGLTHPERRTPPTGTPVAPHA